MINLILKRSVTRFTLLCFIFFSSLNLSYSQAPDYAGEQSATGVSYLEMVDSVMSYFDTTSYDSSEDSELVNFMRWQSYWDAKINYDTAGEPYLDAIEAAAQFAVDGGVCQSCTNEFCEQWEFIGHSETPALGSPGTGQGRLIAIEVDVVHDPTGNTIYVGAPYSGLWKTSNALSSSPTWTCLTKSVILPGMGVNSIAIDPNDANTIYISTGVNEGNDIKYGMGIMKTTEGNLSEPTWSTLSDDVSFSNVSGSAFTQGVYLFPGSSSKIIVLKKNEIWVSTNSGASFTKTFVPVDSKKRFFRDVVFLPTNTTPVGYEIFVSCDDIFSDEGGAFVIKSTDNGNNWTDVTNSIGFANSTEIERIDLAISAANNDLIVAYSDQGISKSTDNGVNWTVTTPSYNSNSIRPVAKYQDLVISPNNVNVMYTGAVTAAKSTDGGSTFTELFAENSGICHADIRKITIYVDGNGNEVALFADDGGVDKFSYNSTSSSWEFSKLNGTGLNISEIYDFDISNVSNEIIIGCQDLGFFKSNSEQSEWENMDYYGDGVQVLHDISRSKYYTYSVPDVHPTKEFTSYSIWHLRSNKLHTMQAADVDQVLTHLNSTRLGVWQSELARDAEGNIYIGENTGTKLYRVKYDAHMIRDGSMAKNRYEEIGDFTTSKNRIYGIGMSKTSTDTIYVGFDRSWDTDGLFKNVLWRTTNATSQNPTWQNLTTNLQSSAWIGISDIVVHPYDPKKIWVCMGIGTITSNVQTSNRIQYSDDGGQTFSFLTGGLTMPDNTPYTLPIYCMVMDEATGGLYIGTQFGVMFNPSPTDVNSDWICFNDGLPSSEVRELKIDYCTRRLIAGTYGHGLWAAPLAKISTEVSVVRSDMLLNVQDNVDVVENVYNEYEVYQTEPLQHYAAHTEYTVSEITPTRVFNRSIVIPSGKTMTIEGKVIMAPNTSITLKPGATLEINGGTLTSSCGQWDGIIVEGNGTLAQNVVTQGFVHILNGGTISNAKNAVHLAGINSNGEINWSTTGGIVVGDDAYFINNTRDVALLEYHNTPIGSGRTIPNESEFFNTRFITDDGYQGNNTKPSVHISMWAVDGIKFYGCLFKDERNNNPNHKMDGIKSVGSTYQIGCGTSGPSGLCVGTKTKFQDLRYAITSYDGIFSPSLDHSVVIKDCEFNNNLGGIYHSGVRLAKVINNDFEISSKFIQNSQREIDSYGTYFEDCDGYHFEENSFISDFSSQTITGLYSVGNVVRLNKSPTNFVYRNFFDDIYIGSESIGWNRDAGGGVSTVEGLKYRCNEYGSGPVGYSDNYIDMYVTLDLEVNYGSGYDGLPEQGGISNPAGNLFGDYSPSTNYHALNVTSNEVYYYHHATNGQPRVEPVYINADIATIGGHMVPIGNVIPDNTQVLLSGNSCEDFTTSIPNTSTVTEIEGYRAVKVDKELDFKNGVDNGNSPQLISRIINVDTNTLPALVSDLMLYSPYLSLDVLLTLAGSDSPITNEIIRDVFILNPHAGRNSKVKVALASRNPVFSGGYWLQIDSASGTTSLYDELLDSMQLSKSNYFWYSNLALCHANSDDSLDHFDELIEPILENANELNQDYMLAFMYDARNSTGAADNVLNNIPSTYSLSSVESDFHTDILALRDMCENWRLSGKNLMSLDSTSISFVKGLANKSNGVEVHARGLLKLNEADTSLGPIYEIDNSIGTSIIPNETGSNNVQQGVTGEDTFQIEAANQGSTRNDRFVIYPNPASDLLQVDYTLKELNKGARFKIVNSLGVTLAEIKVNDLRGRLVLDLLQYPEGLYHCVYQDDFESRETRSFVIKR